MFVMNNTLSLNQYLHNNNVYCCGMICSNVIIPYEITSCGTRWESDGQTSTHATDEDSADPGATERVTHNPIGQNQASGMQYEENVPYLCK